MGILIHIIVNAVLLFVLGRIASGVEVRDGKAAIFGAIALGLANAYVRPLLLVLTLPITMLTLGLFILVVNALMLMLAAAVVPGFNVKGFKSALWGAVLLAVMNLILGIILA